MGLGHKGWIQASLDRKSPVAPLHLRGAFVCVCVPVSISISLCLCVCVLLLVGLSTCLTCLACLIACWLASVMPCYVLFSLVNCSRVGRFVWLGALCLCVRFVCMHACTHVCMHVCMQACANVCVAYIYIYTYVYIYI